MQLAQNMRNIVVRTVPSGSVVADHGYVIGNEFLVCQESATYGTTAETTFLRAGGCYVIGKVASETAARGARAYVKVSTGEISSVAGYDKRLVGTFDEAMGASDEGAALVLAGLPLRILSFLATTAGLTAVAGATQDVDVTCVGATAATVPQVSVNTYAGTGALRIYKAVGATDKITVTIINDHVSAALNAAATLNVTLD